MSSNLRRRFAVTVDGVRYDVFVEELESENAPPDAQDAVAAPSPAPGAASDGTGSATGAPGPSGGAADLPAEGWVQAPMPGTVTEVGVREGDPVKPGDVLMVLTAMKMENEIHAPVQGIVEAVRVQPGATVNNGDPLLRLRPWEE